LERTCEFCGIDISHKKSNARFCCRSHKTAAWSKVRDKPKAYAKVAEWKKRNPNYISPGYKEKHNVDWKQEVSCLCCNTVFMKQTPGQVHCTNKCKVTYNKLLTKIRYYKEHYGEDIWEKTMANPSARYKDKYKIARELGYRSGLEVSFASWLKENNIEFGYETTKVKFVQPEKKRTYIPDFTIGTIILETKGKFETSERQKHLWIKDQYPDLDIRFVFYDENAKLSKRSKTTYADWCEKYGFKYCTFRTGIPETWLNEMKK